METLSVRIYSPGPLPDLYVSGENPIGSSGRVAMPPTRSPIGVGRTVAAIV